MEDLSLNGLFNQHISNTMNRLFTAIPGRVVGSPDLKSQRCDVQILVDRVTVEGEPQRHPLLLNVPIIFPGSKTSQLTFPIDDGDTVMLVFSQRSIDRFKLGSSNGHVPADFRKYSRNDAVAIPGLFTFPAARNDPSKRSLSHSTVDAVLTHNIGTSAECEVRLKASGDVIINAPDNNVTVNCSTANINADESVTVDTPETTVTGNMLVQGHLTFVSGMTGSGGTGAVASLDGSLKATGDISAGKISLQKHRHTGDSGGKTSSAQA